MKPMYFPENINWLVCSDFDETFFAHDLSNAEDVKELDDYIALHAKDSNILFGIVSASTIEMIKHCLDIGHFNYYPHFISSNSGTELRYYIDGKEIYDKDYEQELLKRGFSKTTILDVETQLKSEGIPLKIQEPFINAPFSRNYYYKESIPEVDAANFERIRQLASENHLVVNISKCNPLIGDPADHYDVDFFPDSAGKGAIVKYLIRKFKVPAAQTIAFGDSGNDIKMLNAVKHGYLVSNATPEAKKLYPHVAEHTYSKGILTMLTHIIK
ncbi:HAD-IIB family hydrolase [Macrococcus lamae]|nr:HAD-IIB family hydrolase [Macrococcus lamae]